MALKRVTDCPLLVQPQRVYFLTRIEDITVMGTESTP